MNNDNKSKYYMPLWKFSILSILTLNIYYLVWYYKTWKFINEKYNYNYGPLFRVVLSGIPVLNIIFPYKLFKHIFLDHSKKSTFIASLYAITITLSSLTILYTWYYFKMPIKFLSIFSFIPLLFVQYEINKQY